MPKGHTEYLIFAANMSCQTFFDTYFEQGSEFDITKFYEWQKNLKVESEEWREPKEEESKYGQATKEDLKVHKLRKMFVDVVIEGNPFVKHAPTDILCHLIEHGPNCIKIRKLN